MNYADIKSVDVANGPGVRVSLFVSGCPHHCKGCFNPESWDFQYGKSFGSEQAEEILNMISLPYIKGFSLLGGEPFAPENQSEVLALVRQVRGKEPDKEIWCWTGYLFEDLAAGRVGDHSRELLEEINVLVDGPFVESLKDLSLCFRGSSNQRIINVAASLNVGSTVYLSSSS